MKTANLKEDFIKVWLGDLPEYEKQDAIKALEKLLIAVIEDILNIAKEKIKTNQ